VCDFHGAKAPQVKRKARERLEEAADRLARELLRMATDPAVPESVRLSAIKDALDRGGVSAKTAVEVEVGLPKPWELIMDGVTEVVAGSRDEFRRSHGTSGEFEPDFGQLLVDSAHHRLAALPAPTVQTPATSKRGRARRAGR
jgi:hypothetical protein